MEFIMSEGGWSWLERAAYHGAIGIFYDNTFYGVLAYLIFGLMCFFTLIGIFTTLKWIFKRIFGKKKEKAQK